jgi:curved DNA-binding protein CbpA
MANLFKDSTINYYEILDVSPKATDPEIYQSYLRIKKAYSLRNPELFKNFSLDEIQQLLLYIEEAYATIGNAQSRQLYDAHFFKLQPKMDIQEIIADEEPERVVFSQSTFEASFKSSSDEEFDTPSFDTPSFDGMEDKKHSILEKTLDTAATSSGSTAASTSSSAASPQIPSMNAPGMQKSAVPTPRTPSSTPPEGFGSTATSIYEIDPSFESLIENQQFFDGVFLSKVRKYKKVKLEDFSQQTCISIRYLYAIENNNYSALPAPVFVRGYINQYCKNLDLDAERVITSFMKLYNNGRE